MLFAVTQEMHMGWGGGDFVPFRRDGCMAWNWKINGNVSTVLSRVVGPELDKLKQNVLQCHAVVIYCTKGWGEGGMKRWMDRMKWEGCYNWSSKINKLENLNILLTLRLTCIIYAKFSLEFSAPCQTPCLEALLHHFHQLGIPFSFWAILWFSTLLIFQIKVSVSKQMSTVSTNFITYGLEYIIFNLTFLEFRWVNLAPNTTCTVRFFSRSDWSKTTGSWWNWTPTTCFWTASQLSFFSESTYSTTKPFTSTLSDNPVDATVFLY